MATPSRVTAEDDVQLATLEGYRFAIATGTFHTTRLPLPPVLCREDPML